MIRKQHVNNALQSEVLSYKKATNNQHSKYAHIFRSKYKHVHCHSHIFRLFILERI